MSTHQREAIFTDKLMADVVLNAARWLHTMHRIRLDAIVVMPDHFHLACALINCTTLAKIVHTLKGFTAHKLVDLGVTPPVWQAGYHDHAARSDEEYFDCIRYLLDNPVRAELVDRARDYPFLYAHEDWFND
ncbi:MAG: transposase [Pseudomonadota bacterium]